MVRLKLGEAIRLINERDKKAQRILTEEANKKKQIAESSKAFWERYQAENYIPTIDEIRRANQEIKSERVQKTCTKCGRAFFVLTHHKNMKRKVCRVCKPY